MKNEVYGQNLASIKKKFEGWANNIEEKNYKKMRGVKVLVEESENHHLIAKVEKDKRVLYLNGKYRPEQVVEKWLEQQGEFSFMTTVIIIGIGNYWHVKRILEKVDNTMNVLIYEPCINIFLKMLETVDMRELFEEDASVALVVEGINQWELNYYISQMISLESMSKVKLYLSGNYNLLFPKEVSEFIKKVKTYTVEQIVSWNTVVRYTAVNAQNIFSNIKYLYDGYTILSLRNILPPDLPTIIVSAGPSLNKNINELKNAVGKACIIATDTAMKPLLNAGIIPNMFVVVDGLKPALLFEHKDISKVPMVTMTPVSVESMDAHKGKKIFYWGENPYEDELIRQVAMKQEWNVDIPSITTGGSVATTAFGLGAYMGSRTIILVGQDLAMTGNRTHADGTFQDKMDEIDVEDGSYVEVEDIHGGKVYTSIDFRHYLGWFEKMIKEWDFLKVIDATEGGAKIHGAKIMKLKTAIKNECTKKFSVKWRIDRIPQIADEEGKQTMLEFFLNTPNKLDEVKRKAKQGMCHYEKLYKMAKKKKVPDKEKEKLLKKVTNVNQYMENDYMAGVVMGSLRGLDYVFRPTIYDAKENEKDEMIDIAKQGAIILQAVIEVVDSIKGYAAETIVKFAQEEQKRKEKDHEPDGEE